LDAASAQLAALGNIVALLQMLAAALQVSKQPHVARKTISCEASWPAVVCASIWSP
jgi:hypothetical protein